MAKCVYKHGKGYAAKVKLGETRYYRGRFATEFEAEAWVLQARAAHKLGHPISQDGPGPRVMTPVPGADVAASKQKDLIPFFSIGGRLYQALSLLKHQHNDMTVLQAMCLAYVAQNHTVSQQSLWQDIGIPSSIASRNIAILSHFGVRGTPPLRLIDTVENPEIGDSACCRLLLRDGD